MSTVHPPPPASKSYRDAVVPRSPSSVGFTSLPSTSPSATVLEPALSAAQVELLQQQFPHRVTISSEKFAASTRAWSNALIGKCLGRDLSADSMSAALSPQWSAIGEWEIFPLTNGFFVFRFSSPEARDEVLLGGPWIVEGAVLALSQFDPAFHSSSEQVLRAVLWVRLPELPPGFWTDDIISDILMVVGRVVRLDDHTRLRTRGRFARAAVEIDLRQPLLPGVTVGVESDTIRPFWQVFQYENVHSFCFRCRCVGHKASSCVQLPDSPMAIHGSGDTVSASVLEASSSVERVALPATWASTLMVRRSHGSSTAVVGGVRSQREKGSRARISKHSTSTTSQAPNQTRGISPTHVEVAAAASTLPDSTCGPSVKDGLAIGLSSPTISTSAIGPKPTELSSSDPSPQVCSGPLCVGDGLGGNAMDEVYADEDHLIHEILLDNADIDDELQFTVAGKKKKYPKGKMKEVCLRLEPRNRALKKKGKVGSGFGSFSLLQDLAGNTSISELVEKYGPPTGIA